MPAITGNNTQGPVCQHVGIFVDNLERVGRFYSALLGFVQKKEMTLDAKTMQGLFGVRRRARVRYLERYGFGVELICFEKARVRARKKRTAGLDHWTLLVQDKDRFCVQLKKRKVPVIKVARPLGFVYFIKDPEGNLIEVKNR